MDENPYESPQTFSGDHVPDGPSLVVRAICSVCALVAGVIGITTAVAALCIALEMHRNISLGRTAFGGLFASGVLVVLTSMFSYGSFYLVSRLGQWRGFR